MNSPEFGLIEEFAQAFAKKGKGSGMSNDEIKEYFSRYSNNIAPHELFEKTKQDYFISAISFSSSRIRSRISSLSTTPLS